jgi:hypothetical protein
MLLTFIARSSDVSIHRGQTSQCPAVKEPGLIDSTSMLPLPRSPFHSTIYTVYILPHQESADLTQFDSANLGALAEWLRRLTRMFIHF